MRNTKGSHPAHCSQGVGLCNVSVNLLSGILRGHTPPTVAKGVEQCSASVNLLSGGGRLVRMSTIPAGFWLFSWQETTVHAIVCYSVTVANYRWGGGDKNY